VNGAGHGAGTGAMRFGGFSRPFRGLTVCGDRFFAAEAEGSVVAAVVDGLGHGFESSVAAERAVEVIREHLHLSPEAIVLRCHGELRPTRGAAVGVLKIEPSGRGEFCGVGNIEVQSLVGRPPSIFCLAGIVGHNLRQARSMPFQMDAGDVYCVLSDGVSARGDGKRSCLPGPPDEVARRIVETWGRAHDDATALVLGYHADALLSTGAAESGR
jgi:hypothetical protein